MEGLQKHYKCSENWSKAVSILTLDLLYSCIIEDIVYNCNVILVEGVFRCTLKHKWRLAGCYSLPSTSNSHIWWQSLNKSIFIVHPFFFIRVRMYEVWNLGGCQNHFVPLEIHSLMVHHHHPLELMFHRQAFQLLVLLHWSCFWRARNINL